MRLIVVRPGKEIVLRAIFRDIHGELKDPVKQEITITDELGVRTWIKKSPQRLDIGMYKAILKIPKDAQEGMYRIEWIATVDDQPVLEIVEVEVSKEKKFATTLQMHLQAKDFIMTFLERGMAISYGVERILIDNVRDDATAIIVSNARNGRRLKEKQLSIPVHLNKFTQKLLSKEEYPFRRKIFWKNPFYVSSVKITPIPVVHSQKAPTTGLMFEVNNQKVAYLPSVLDLHDRSVLNGVNLYIGDGKSLDRDLVRQWKGKKYGHASIRTQLSWLQAAKVPRVIFTNLGKWAVDKKVTRSVFEALSQEFSIEVAEDNCEVYIGKDIQLQSHALGLWEPKDQLPYVLSLHAVKNSWIPPHNISALPKDIRMNIPTRYIYWLKNNTNERLAARDRLVKALQMDEVQIHGISLQNPPEIEEPIEAKATLQHRGGNVHEERWDLHVGELLHFVLQSNPIDATSTPAVFKHPVGSEWVGTNILEEVKSDEKTETFIRTIDRGTIKILGSGVGFVRVDINMQRLKGIYVFKRLERMNLWMMKKEEK